MLALAELGNCEHKNAFGVCAMLPEKTDTALIRYIRNLRLHIGPSVAQWQAMNSRMILAKLS